mgnify:CR=1 FL=1
MGLFGSKRKVEEAVAGGEAVLGDGRRIEVARRVDCRGDSCPRPQLMTKKAVGEIAPGGVVEVFVDNPSSVEIRIEDRGAGIPAEERERVFEPYVRLEASRARHTGGAGLGLAIARAVARAHGGDVRLEAREGGGTTAVVTLPRR